MRGRRHLAVGSGAAAPGGACAALSAAGGGRDLNFGDHRQILTTIDSWRDHADMSTNTMSFALPEALRSYVDQRVRSGQYGNTSEYLRELIRRDQEEQAKKRLRELIEEGLNSGSGRTLTAEIAAQLRERALGGLR